MNQREIARLAGVSTATVSRVINNDRRVTEQTRKRVQQAIDENGYVQNMNARNLRVSHSHAIGFLISNFANPFFLDVYCGFEPVLKKLGYNIIIGNTNEDIEQEKDAIDLMLQYRVDGIVASFVGPSSQTLGKITQLGAEVLQLDRKLPHFSSDCVVIDNIAGAMQQVEYLAKLGHTRIALIKGTDFDSNGIDRLRGFHMGMEKMGLPVRPEYIVGGEFLEDAAYRATVELLSRPERPTAIIAHNNLMCIGAYRALRDMRINIPAEISLIGFDDFEFSEHLQPSITLIDRPVREMGELAGKMMIERIEKTYTGAARQVVFPVRLKVGGSCSVPADN